MAGRVTRGERNARWIERHCVIPEGPLVGQPVKLTDKQREWIKLIYDTPTRMCIISMGRKNAKTALSAFLLLLHLAGPEAVRNGQLYSAAQSRDQAALTFNYASKCARMSRTLRDVVQVRDTKKELLCPELGTVYRALSAEASTAYGLSPTFVIHDELGQVRGPRSELYEALETACAGQANPLSIVISTQAPNPDDLLSVLIDDAMTGADPTKKVVLYSAPMDCDPFSDEAIRAANPHYDVFMNRDEVRRQAEEARRLPSREAAYRNLVLNQRIESNNLFVSREVWIANGSPPIAVLERRRKVWGGLDLSSVGDLTALVLMCESADRCYDVMPYFWLPKDGLAERSKADRVPYDVWARDGHLIAVPGKSIDYAWVASQLRVIFDEFDVQAIAFDRYNMRFLTPWLQAEGFSDEELARFIDFGQGFVSMSPALRQLEEMLLNEKLRHGNHPVLTMCAANAVVISDPAGNRKFAKNKSTGRIDGMVALAMAAAMVGTQRVDEVKQPGIVLL